MNTQRQTEGEAFSERLRTAMADAGIKDARGSLQRLADAGGVSHTAARKWLSGEQLPDAEKMVKLSKWLLVSSTWLQSGMGRKEIIDLDDVELDLIRNYRVTDSRGKYIIITVAKAEATTN